jgi:hypothetical protein
LEVQVDLTALTVRGGKNVEKFRLLQVLRAQTSHADNARMSGRFHEAADMSQVIVATSTRVLRDEHDVTLNALNNLAATYRTQGLWIEAAELQEKTLRICGRVLGEEHLHTLNAMNKHMSIRDDGLRLHE